MVFMRTRAGDPAFVVVQDRLRGDPAAEGRGEHRDVVQAEVGERVQAEGGECRDAVQFVGPCGAVPARVGGRYHSVVGCEVADQGCATAGAGAAAQDEDRAALACLVQVQVETGPGLDGAPEGESR